MAPNFTPAGAPAPIAPPAAPGAQPPGLTAALLVWITNGVLPAGYPPGGGAQYPAIGAREKPLPESYLVLPDIGESYTTRELRIISATLNSTRTLAGRHFVGTAAANTVVADNARLRRYGLELPERQRPRPLKPWPENPTNNS